MIISFRYYISILLIFLSFSVGAETYRLVSEEYPPYEYLKDNTPVGMDVELLQLAASKVKIDFKIIFLPWARALEMVKSGTADGIFSLMKNEERSHFLLYPETYLYIASSSLFVRKNFSQKIEKIKDLKGKRVGVVYGNSYGEEFDKASYIVKESVVDHETLIKKLIGKREDMIITTKEVGYYLARKYGANDIRHLPLIVSRDLFYIGISKKSLKGRHLYKKISEGLKQIQESGEADKIRQKYINF